MKHLTILIKIVLTITLCFKIAYTIELTTEQSKLLNIIDAKYISYKSIKSKFTQTDHVGNSTTGWFAISRPKLARIEYADLKLRFIANSTSLLFDDLNQNQKTILPIQSSIFAYLLEENTSLLNKDVEILEFMEKNNFIKITLQNKKNPEIGNITLQIQKSNGHIMGWEIKDAVGAVTTVVLNNPTFSTNAISPSSMFNIQRVRDIEFNNIKQ